MDKRVIFAVAGAGKTTRIINSLSLTKRSLIVTYTENNYTHLKNSIIKKFGFFPENITLLTYFTFLYSFCYKPFFHYRCNSKGINWEVPPPFTLKLSRSDKRFFMDDYNRLYSNRIAKLVNNVRGRHYINNRISKYFDDFFVDEVQDFSGHDFDLLISLCEGDVNICFVGDFYQHTFDTSRDGNVNCSLYDDYKSYKSKFSNAGLVVDVDSLSRSYRCSSQVCDFVESKLGISIKSHKSECSEVVFLEDDLIEDVFSCDDTIKLFFKNSKKYPCFSQNWGKSKGQDHYLDVCIALYKTSMILYKKNSLVDMPPSSKNKLYVACTRANRNIYFVEESKLKKYMN